MNDFFPPLYHRVATVLLGPGLDWGPVVYLFIS